MTFKNITTGARVKYQDRFGTTKSGKANGLLLFPSHVVINIGGRYGTPIVVDERNYVSHKNVV